MREIGLPYAAVSYSGEGTWLAVNSSGAVTRFGAGEAGLGMHASVPTAPVVVDCTFANAGDVWSALEAVAG